MKSYNYNLGISFYNLAEKYSNKSAIIYDNKNYSFQELNELSNCMARVLLESNVTSGSVIAIFNNKTIYGFSAMLACLKIGAIYVNLDFNSPFERLERILNTCNPLLILNDYNYKAEYFNEINISIHNIHNEDYLKLVSAKSNKNIEETEFISSSDPAYIMFTSGSTGFPKGATMTHQNVLNFIAWGKERYEVTKDDRFTNVNPLYFDNSVFDFYISLYNGASIIPFDYDETRNPIIVRSKVEKLEPTIWFSVPSMLIFLMTMKIFNGNDFESLRIISFGGEGFPKSRLKKLFDAYSDRIEFINVYGPTECTCICSAHNIENKDFEDMESLAPLGKLAPNFKFILLKDNNANDYSELCLCGPQVGLGYYNDSERTKCSFVQNPENKKYREIIYKTGDLVSVDDFGMFHFKGRKDNQIKHMGYRIELEEIEAAFNSISEISESAVIYKRTNNNNTGAIYAYIITDSDINEEVISAMIKSKLPQYMIPKEIKFLDKLPKNKNGKTDRIKLLEDY